MVVGCVTLSVRFNRFNINLRFFHFFPTYILFIYMGRKLKYITHEQKLNANREKYMRYYWKNQELVKKKNLKRYYAKKETNHE